MKSIRWTIWILGTLLVVATVDSRPDPPAVNPSTALAKVLQLPDCSCDTATRLSDAIATSVPVPVSLVAAEASQPYRPSDRMILTGQAADPSPPTPQAGRKLFFQS